MDETVQPYPDFDPEFDPAVFGQNVKRMRRLRGYSTRELATRAGVARASLLRAEHGLSTRASIRNRVCAALDTRLSQMCLAPVPDEYAVHRAAEEKWSIVRGVQRSPRAFTSQDLGAPEERRRIGKLGWAARFTNLFGSVLVGSPMAYGMIELHGPQDALVCHPGEEFVFCISGRVRVLIGKATVELEEGDSITFDSNVNHSYEPADPVRGAPPKLLLVMHQGGKPADH